MSLLSPLLPTAGGSSHAERMMKLILIALILLGVSCTSTGGPDWPAIAIEVETGAADLRDATLLVEDEELRGHLWDLAALADTAAWAMEQAPDELPSAIDAAMAATEAALELTDDDKIQVALIAIRIGLRRAKAHFP